MEQAQILLVLDQTTVEEILKNGKAKLFWQQDSIGKDLVKKNFKKPVFVFRLSEHGRAIYEYFLDRVNNAGTHRVVGLDVPNICADLKMNLQEFEYSVEELRQNGLIYTLNKPPFTINVLDVILANYEVPGSVKE